MEPIYFENKQALRKWFMQHRFSKTELLLGYYKTHTGKPSVTWSDSVDEALCVGWIDGIRRTVDENRYTIRFTPRRQSSVWSAVNIAKIEQLTKDGLMLPEGIAIYEKRKTENGYGYSNENRITELSPAYQRRFEANANAWAFFNAAAPGYRKVAIHFIMSAKQEATQQRRLDALIVKCGEGEKFWL